MKQTVIQRLAVLADRVNNLQQISHESLCDAENELDEFVRTYLPSGNGFDRGTSIKSYSNNEIILEAPYHLMNDNGVYVGWIDFIIEVKARFIDIKLTVTPDVKDEYYVTDYVADTMYDAMMTEIDI